jgi:hypothetical protein
MVAFASQYAIPQKVQDSLIQFCKSTVEGSFANVDLRGRFEYIDREYIRENTMAVDQHAQSAGANRMGNKRKIQDIVIPIVEPQVETSLSYLTSVFLTGNPMFGVVADAERIDAAKQFEAVISENSIRGGWTRELMMFFRDGLKYNFSAVAVEWETEKTYGIETDAKYGAEGKPKEVVWQGNKIKRLDPYNTIFDLRVPITRQHLEAEFVGYVELKNRVALAEFLHRLPFRMNVTKAYESVPGNTTNNAATLYYIPEVFTENMSNHKLTGMMNWDAWASAGKTLDIQQKFKNLYVVVTRYVRIIPSDFGMQVPARGSCQIWKLITVNDQVLVFAERMSNAHGMLPVLFGQPIEDGLNLQTKSFAQKQIPMQDIASSLANSKLAARRRLVADRGLFDPSRIREADINSDNPSAKIPVRPTAYGQDLSKAYYQIPFRDEQTGTLMQDVREVVNYSDLLSGQNRAQQGQFVKGNKTKEEYEDTMGKSSGRQQTMAINLEAQVFTPLKEILKYNILQFQPAGDVYSYEDKKVYNVNPVELRKTVMQFKVSDGMIPSDKIIDSKLYEVSMQVMGSAPAIGEDYKIGDMFAYLMKLKGADLTPFKYTAEEKKQRQDNQMKMMEARANMEAKAKGVPSGA